MMTAALHARLLGCFELSFEGRPLPVPTTRKAQALLAYLVLRREQPQMREHLADLFWGDRPEEKARRSLSTAAWQISRCLPGKHYLLNSAYTLQFDPRVSISIDACEFEAYARRGDTAGLQAAIELYQGEFLSGSYEEWIIRERYRLENLYLDSLGQLMSAYEALAQIGKALETAQKLLSYDDLREDAHRSAMRSYCLLGKRSQALEQYQQCKQAIWQELSAEPSLETRQLYQAIKDGKIKPGAAAYPTDLPPAPHPLRTNWPPISTIDPAYGMDFAGAVAWQLFSGLVTITPELHIAPDAALHWETLAGGRKYIFNLKPGLRWSDGRPLNAYDFEYSAKRILSPCVQSPLATLLYDIKAGQSFHQGEVDDFSLVGLRALDESRLLIELEKPAPYFLHLLVNFVATPRHCIEAFGDNWTEPQHIVTSGPFHVQEWKSDELMLLAQFPNYHGKRTGNLQSVLLSLQPDPAANLASFAANELDVLDLRFYPMDFYEKALGQYWGEYYSLPAASISFLGFNTRKAPFDDQRVRRAFAMAFDKETLAGKVQRGTVFPASGGLAPPGLPGHTGGIGLQYDPGLAQECLAQAGYPNGNGFPELTALTPLETNDPISLFLAEQWKKVLGINLAWQTVSPGLYRVLDKEPPLLFLSYWHADYPDPDDFLGAGQFLRWTGWQDDHYLRLLEETRQTSNQSLRLNLFAQADRLLVQQAAIVPLAYLRQHFLIKPWVKRYPTTTLYSWFWKDVIIEAH